jgi:broad specificity phosphatase PhoE
MFGKKFLKNTYFALRHGNSEKNELDLVVSWPEAKEYHLTDLGREQVQKSAKWLADKEIDLLYASDLTRAQESAEIITKELKLDVKLDKRLRELDFGTYNNKTHTEFKEFFKDKTNLQERFEHAPPQGENWQQLVKRMLGFLAWLEGQHENKNILLISHGDPLWLLQWATECVALEALNDMPYPETGKAFKLGVKCLPGETGK